MGNNQSEREYEEIRLKQTISLAEEQLKQAKEAAEKKKSQIIEAKKEVRENATHSVTNLYTSDGFEALVELSQYMNPVTDKIVDYEEEEHRILLLENMIKSPYFARIDFKFDDEEECEKIYIGRSSLRKNSYQEMYVYDWRSPIASIFYRFMKGEAFYDAPCGRVTGELKLKRQYEIKNGVLKYFFDTDVQIVDEFLRQLLSQNTTAKMKAIVETIQQEQDAVIRDMENDLLMVQGVAGSGKTSIALHRAAYLMYQGLQTKLSANNIMIISPNTIFEQYISNVLPELGEDNVISVVFEDILKMLLKGRKIQSKNDFLAKIIAPSQYKKIYKDSIEFKASKLFGEILDKFIYDIPCQWIEFDDVYYEGTCVVNRQTLQDKILGRTETPLGIKLEQLEDYILELIFGTGKGRGHKAEKNLVKQEIQKFIKIDIFELSPDLIILDLMLPFISGDELIRNIRKFSDVPVIVVSAKSLTFNKVELLRLGADDYLTKPFDLDELLARIERNLLRSQKDTPHLCLTFGELSINTSSKIVTVADEIIVLTAKEYQLVELLAKYPDKVFSKQNLYESIWQEPFARDNDVINTHISNLRKKLKGEGCRIKTIWGLGYRFAK